MHGCMIRSHHAVMHACSHATLQQCNEIKLNIAFIRYKSG